MNRFFGITGLLLMIALLSVPVSAIELSWNDMTNHAAFTPRAGFSLTVFDDRMWVIGGFDEENHYYNDVWYSSDGIHWNPAAGSAAFSPRYGHTTLVFNDQLWVIGGFDGTHKNDVWSSPDGITWTEITPAAAFAPRNVHTSVVYNGRMWVIGGETGEVPVRYTNDVWYSSDGATWIRATAGAPFSPRVGHSSVVYDDKMWVLGGMGDASGKIRYNDVWCSADGIHWDMPNGSAGFYPRYYLTSSADSDNIFIIGGADGRTTLNDIWASSDGVIWLPVSSGDRFPPRNAHSAVIYRDRIWVIGGIDQTHRLFNDVWYSSELSGPAPMDPGVVITKTVSPRAVKQGTDLQVNVTFTNGGSHSVHDVEILDTTLPEFPVTGGMTRAQIPDSLMPHESYTIIYTMRASEAGRFTLPGTSACYAGEDGNYHRIVSSFPSVEVIAPLISPPGSSADMPGLSPDAIVNWIASFFSPISQKGH